MFNGIRRVFATVLVAFLVVLLPYFFFLTHRSQSTCTIRSPISAALKEIDDLHPSSEHPDI